MIDDFPEDVVLQKYNVPEILELSSKLFAVCGNKKQSMSDVVKLIEDVLPDFNLYEMLDNLIQYKLLETFDGGLVFTSIAENYASQGKIFKDDALEMMRGNQMTEALFTCFGSVQNGLNVGFVPTAMGFLNATFDYPQEDLDKFADSLKKNVDFYHTCNGKEVYDPYKDQTFMEAPDATVDALMLMGSEGVNIGEIPQDLLDKAAHSLNAVLKASGNKGKKQDSE